MREKHTRIDVLCTDLKVLFFGRSDLEEESTGKYPFKYTQSIQVMLVKLKARSELLKFSYFVAANMLNENYTNTN